MSSTGGGTLKNVGGPLYVCGALSVRAYVCVSTSIFQGLGRCLGLWAGHWRISVGGHPTRRKSKDLKKSLTVEPDELPFPKRPAENKFKTSTQNKNLISFFSLPLCTFYSGGKERGGACYYCCYCYYCYCCYYYCYCFQPILATFHKENLGSQDRKDGRGDV